MAIVGFVDDYLGVRKARNLGLRKRGKTAGELVVGGGFALLALTTSTSRPTCRSPASLDLDLGTGVLVRARRSR